jgi:D-tyrosyl-tRNA(Tyr) deacylase
VRAVVQRVSSADVAVEGEVISSIGAGLLVLLGVEEGDGDADLAYIVEKIAHLRVFADECGKMNRSVLDTGGAVLLVSQFTLLGDARRGRRPSYTLAAQPEMANAYYERAARSLEGLGVLVQTGQFMAHMQVSLVNDGPVTILLDSRKRF